MISSLCAEDCKRIGQISWGSFHSIAMPRQRESREPKGNIKNGLKPSEEPFAFFHREAESEVRLVA
jgi:hypothetical protein